MDDFNKNPFEEENYSDTPAQAPDTAPIIPEQPVPQQNPYNMPASQNAYQESNPYNQTSSNPFTQQAAAYEGPKPTSGLATASMVLGIISIVLWLFLMMFPPLLLLPIISIILGIVHKTKHLPVGKGSSTAGIVTSTISLVLCIALIVIAVVIVMNSGDLMYNSLQTIKEAMPDLYEQYYDMFYDMYPEWFDGAIKMLGCLFLH